MPSFSPASLSTDEKLRVVATTNIVADVVWNVGGDRIELTALMPVGTDPHSFEPIPRDVAAVSDAHVVFANGAGLEEFLEPLLESASATEKVVYVSQGIEIGEFEGERTGEHDHDHGEGSPHTWTDPNNVALWVHTIEGALSALDPDNSASYKADAGAYETALKELDGWIRTQVAQIPETDRKIVTDHSIFDYFADRYGFTQVGTIIPGYSTIAEPSARELAELEDTIRALGIKAVFVGNTVNPSLAERVAEDTGTQLVFVYTGSLSEKGGPADSYIAYVRYNIEAIVSALR
jgi:ABC-type Zn uptake system ZnuABC Zn-binding protein ZnuA